MIMAELLSVCVNYDIADSIFSDYFFPSEKNFDIYSLQT